MSRSFWPLAITAVLSVSSIGYATTYVVEPDGTGDFPTIQSAIDFSEDGDIIELTDGTFTGNGNRDIDYLGKAVVVRSAGGNPVLCVIDCEGTYPDGHRGFHFHSGEGRGSMLANVTVTGGLLEYGSGAGIMIDGASPTISGCNILDNLAGSPAHGGGICCLNGSSPDIYACTITGNMVGSFRYVGTGGGIYSDDTSDLNLEDCTVADNAVMSPGGQGMGGGIDCEQATILGCTIEFNESEGSGGGISCGAATITDCVVSGNHGIWSGGLAGSGATITRCTFHANTCLGDGTAGVTLSGGEIAGCVITGNSSASPYTIGGIRATSGCVVDSCTIASNSAAITGGMYVSEALVSNSIIWGNCGDNAGSEEVYASSGLSFFRCCDVDPSKVSGAVQYVDPLNADPLFCDPEICTNAPTVNGDYHLTVESPCAPENNPDCGRIGAMAVGCVASDAQEAVGLPGGLLLSESRPNPFSGQTWIRYRLQESVPVRLEVFDVRGRSVRVLVDARQYPDHRSAEWDGRDDSGKRVRSGIYFYRLQAGKYAETRRMVLLK